ncbi:MATE family multidrug resistance protein [Patellaria atrata CBS 101060]|uniref:MATE family multidrug resistance protein n=1 Tax=Patellaria atrata CBS 101060 TaxID=1346257 RepID=A0A9P4VSV5_9PEZI|nr:MATE family multidrug resistance protein [Patellaria atrata CBS 101060]
MSPGPTKPDESSPRAFSNPFRSPLGSFASSSPIAEASIARDIEDGYFDSNFEDEDDYSESNTLRPRSHSAGSCASCHRPSFVYGSRPTYVGGLSVPEQSFMSCHEGRMTLEDARSLLRDNGLVPPKHPRNRSNSGSFPARLYRATSLPGIKIGKQDDEESSGANGQDDSLSETTALLGDSTKPYGGLDTREHIDKKWDEAMAGGKINTSWQRESKVLVKYSRPLILTFLLQYSLTMASVFVVGHIGKVELGAVSLAAMTANITGYAVYQGLATSLDTLCAQAYGSGRKKLVGVQLQRMVFFLWLITIPIAIIWLNATSILKAIVPNEQTAILAGQYLKILLIGIPGYAAFESGKRFVQAQGLFSATLYVLLFCAPVNALMNYLFVWHFGWGFIGAPIAVACTELLLPTTLFAYVYFINGRECWGGFERRAFRNWGPMIRLAIPGLVMVLAEFLAFEILTLSASWISVDHLAAQSVLQSVTALTFQIPFPMSIAASTRIANLIGASLPVPAKTAAKVALVASIFVGVLNITLLSSLRNYIPRLFTREEEVITLIANLLPLCAAFQLFDSLATTCNGILRGLGKQEIGGYVALFAYYVIAMPISFGTCFGLHWDLYGLWGGPAIALGVVAVVEGIFIYYFDWQQAVDDANLRNSAA